MFHSLTLGDKNTWSNWHLIPTTRPVVNPPPVNEKYVEIPGRNGSIDLTTFLSGSPTYGNRKGSWEFYVICKGMEVSLPTGYLTTSQKNALWADWKTAYDTILNYLHGKNHSVALDDDPDYVYTGRMTVNSFKSDKDNSTITIDYVLAPYKQHKTNLSYRL